MTPLYAIAFDWPDAGTSGWWSVGESLGIDPGPAVFTTHDDAVAMAAELREAYPSATYTVVMLAPVAIEPVDTATANAVIMAIDTFGRNLGEVPKLVDMKAWAEVLEALCEAATGRRWDAGPAMHADPNVWLPLVAFGEVDRLRPELLAMEQVPGVLALWQAFGTVLDGWGYSWWAGVLNAADYGVPQTRRRAILMASRAGVAHPPAATHAQAPEPSLFGTLEPWVTIADALGWTGRVGFPRRDEDDPTGYRERDWRPCDEPAQHVTEKARSWILDRRQNGAPVLDPAEVPAPTLTGAAGAKGVWGLREKRGGERTTDEPALTVTASHDNGNLHWAYDRLATPVANDTRVWPPGHKVNADDRRRHEDADERYGDRAVTDAIRITVRAALTLQGFDPDRPLVGSKTSQFRQVGNAVPPPVAAAVARALMESR